MITATRPVRRLALIGAIVALLAACAAPDTGDPDLDPTPEAPTTPAGTPTSEAAAPEEPADPPDASPQAADPLFHGQEPTVDGGTFDLATLAGRDVAAWFWAPW